jgi:6-phosphogluconolactonase/glucosamine-6-phosphate isomerase/deaminase
MYELMWQAALNDLSLAQKLKGETGSFSLGMVDGLEWTETDPLDFRYYFYQRFLKNILGFPSLCSYPPSIRKQFLDQAYAFASNIFIPHLDPADSPTEKEAGISHFGQWLRARLPIDLVVLGLGPDGHIAFLGPGQVLRFNGVLAERVRLWDEIRDWKWLSGQMESCICTQETCEAEKTAPEFALTVTLETILSARQVLLMAFGPGKAEAVRRLIKEDPVPEKFTAHYLALAEGKVTILIDQDAALLL